MQHIALKTENILEAIAAMRKRGVQFLTGRLILSPFSL